MWHKIKSFFKGILGEIAEFLSPLAREIAASGGKLLLQAAAEAVLAAEHQGGSGADKFKAARTSVIATLEKNGIPIVLNAVHGAIEGAVAKLNQEK